MGALVDTSMPRQRGSLPRRHYFSKIQKLINFKKTVLEYHAKIWTCMGPCLEEHVRSGCCFSCTRLLLRLIWYGCTAVHSCTLNHVCVCTMVCTCTQISRGTYQVRSTTSTTYSSVVPVLGSSRSTGCCAAVDCCCCTWVQLQYGSTAVVLLYCCYCTSRSTAVLRLRGKQEIGSRSFTGYQYPSGG